MRFVVICLLILSAQVFATDSDKQTSVADFTEHMSHQTGFFDFYYQIETDKVFLKIDKFDQPFLFQSSMPQGIGSNDIGLDRGQLGDTRLVKFERFGNKVLLKQLNTQYRASSSNLAEQASIDEAFADSVIAGFVVVATDGDGVVIDYTDFLLSDIHQISERLTVTEQGSYQAYPKRSGVFLKRSKSFPDNTELEALVTFGGSKPGQYVDQVTPDPISISVHLHHSLVKLPDTDYQPRKFVPFSGFWSVGYEDYSVPIEQSMTKQFIPRHRLNKKQPNMDMSEAIEPIVYYLDPGIPEPVMSALKDGALWWDQAFSAIGYKNAFQVKVLPEDADPMDVRYNVIQWVHRATRGWSYGSSVIDPRSGEIIKGHVTLGSLRVKQDYLIALGLTSPFSADGTGADYGGENNPSDAQVDTSKQKEMALARIRQLSAHEVGHTLGISHNFAASEYGRESVMDYPHPLVSIKDGKISLDNAYDVGMGAWDKYVVAYGYQEYPDAITEQQALKDLVTDARAKGFKYLSDPDARQANAANAQGHLWDNGADPVTELSRISEVRQVAMANFGLKTIKTGATLSSLEETFAPIYLLHRYQLDAVAKLIGGVSYEYESKGDYAVAKGVKVIAAQQQKDALAAMLQTLQSEFLSIPKSLAQLITPKAYGESRNRESFKGRTGHTFDPISAAESAAGYSLNLLLQAERLNRIAQQQEQLQGVPDLGYLLTELFNQSIKDGIDKDYPQLSKRVNYLVLDQVVKAMQQENLAPEARGEMELQLIDLHKWLKNKGRNAHNEVMARQLEQYWRLGKWQSQFTLKPLPPGSPI
ncbi:zinc-dependent metalloprotease [Paraglaciecola sp. MB-3u-78]|uniref:zinc-dependent metalloprotease n=1 Tax=Paraglaciecola sp. MB-3u-78 TaxID=2058332 RepID=UPI000C343367|nr:zinc-dependent metalloprotease [Paraglaciecola sp. MB-3u-78]PKG98784.1 peptidase [Paraglaciecola sp. MB-3u-78]